MLGSFRWKVGLRELPEQFAGRLVIGAGGCFLVSKAAKVNQSPHRPDSGAPLAGARKSLNAIVTRGVVGVPLPVPQIFGVRCQPEITAPIVKTVAVDVINFHSIRSIHDDPMHTNLWSTGHPSFDRGLSRRIAILAKPPIPRQILEIFIINRDHHSLAA
jgi:hypothetical protein